MSTIRDTIKSNIQIQNGEVIPSRSKEQMEQEKKERGILDKEYIQRSDGAYKTIRPEDMITAASTTSLDEEEESKTDNLAVNSVKHTDGYICGGKFHNSIVTKTTTAVLDSIKEGTYDMLKYSIDFKRTDADSMEATIPAFVKNPIDIPRGTASFVYKEIFIAIEPQPNGFYIACLVESIPDKQREALEALEDFTVNLQGYILENTLMGLKSSGISVQDLIRSQLLVGVVPAARKRFERIKAEQERKASGAEKIVITDGIRTLSAEVADDLNAKLQSLPLTGESVTLGLDYKRIAKTINKEIIESWSSKRAGISYFKQGDTYGRIENIRSSRRTIPILADFVPKVISIVKELIPCVIDIFENTARAQVGDYPIIAANPLPFEKIIEKDENGLERVNKKVYTPEHYDVVDLFKYDRVKACKEKMAIMNMARQFVDDKAEKDDQNEIKSLLSKYLSAKEKSTIETPEASE